MSTKLELLQARLATQNATKTATKTVKKPTAIGENDTLIAEIEQDLLFGKWRKIRDFKTDLEGSRRLLAKVLLQHNAKSSWKELNHHDKEDMVMEIYCNILALKPQKEPKYLRRTTTDYFGISTFEEFDVAYNTLRRFLRHHRNRSVKTEYSQDFEDGSNSFDYLVDDEAEREIDQITHHHNLSQILPQEQREVLALWEQGLTQREIAAELKITYIAVRRRWEKIKATLQVAYAVA